MNLRKEQKRLNFEARMAKVRKNKLKKAQKISFLSGLANDRNFYSSIEWLRVRFDALHIHRTTHGPRCLLCGTSERETEFHVDHIKPRSIAPELELSVDNLQVLCSKCNIGKGNRYSDSYKY